MFLCTNTRIVFCTANSVLQVTQRVKRSMFNIGKCTYFNYLKLHIEIIPDKNKNNFKLGVHSILLLRTLSSLELAVLIASYLCVIYLCML